MRKLTLKRKKSLVASIMKVKVYIEDENCNEIQIGGVPCRKLGTLKNGEEKTFEISEESAKLFVIVDKVSKNFCNDFYQLPAGNEDISLSGKNVFNPFAGNPFYFDGVTDENVLKNRKKGKKIGIAIAISAFIVGFVIGFCLIV